MLLSRVFLAPLSRSRLKKKKPGAGAAWKKSQEPEQLEKKQEPEPLKKKSGAGVPKKLAGSPALEKKINSNELSNFSAKRLLIGQNDSLIGRNCIPIKKGSKKPDPYL